MKNQKSERNIVWREVDERRSKHDMRCASLGSYFRRNRLAEVGEITVRAMRCDLEPTQSKYVPTSSSETRILTKLIQKTIELEMLEGPYVVFLHDLSPVFLLRSAETSHGNVLCSIKPQKRRKDRVKLGLLSYELI